MLEVLKSLGFELFVFTDLQRVGCELEEKNFVLTLEL